MKTLQEALIWAQQQVGKSLNWGGWSQCVSLPRYYIQFLGFKQFPAVQGAVNMDDQPWPSDQFDTKHDNPQPGDIAILGPTKGNPYGHCDIVLEVHPTKLVTIDQNFYNPKLDGKEGSPTARVEWPWPNSRFVTFYSPKFDAPKAPENTPPLPAAPGKLVIKKGDTFWDLENTNGWPHGTLQQLNPHVQATTLQIGQEISVPTSQNHPAPVEPHVYVVTAGDTLSGIAQKLGIKDWRTLYDKNRPLIGNDPDLIRPGQRLLLP